MRREEEFYCPECGKYFLTYLRNNMTGNYTIECPNCKHHHFRKIEAGLITGQRHDTMSTAEQYKEKGVELIISLKSTVRDTPYHDDPDWKRKNLISVVE